MLESEIKIKRGTVQKFMRNKTYKTGKSFIVSVSKDGKSLDIQGDEKEIKRFIKLMKSRGFKIERLEIRPCI